VGTTGLVISITGPSSVPLARSPRNPRRASDKDGNEIPPMTLANMREHGLRSVEASCQEIGCQHEGSVNVDDRPGNFPIPDVALRLRCSAYGSRNVKTTPDWAHNDWHARSPGRSSEG